MLGIPEGGRGPGVTPARFKPRASRPNTACHSGAAENLSPRIDDSDSSSPRYHDTRESIDVSAWYTEMSLVWFRSTRHRTGKLEARRTVNTLGGAESESHRLSPCCGITWGHDRGDR